MIKRYGVHYSIKNMRDQVRITSTNNPLKIILFGDSPPHKPMVDPSTRNLMTLRSGKIEVTKTRDYS
jgi:hypothetical protein